jgi:hypothetical protein
MTQALDQTTALSEPPPTHDLDHDSAFTQALDQTIGLSETRLTPEPDHTGLSDKALTLALDAPASVPDSAPTQALDASRVSDHAETQALDPSATNSESALTQALDPRSPDDDRTQALKPPATVPDSAHDQWSPVSDPAATQALDQTIVERVDRPAPEVSHHQPSLQPNQRPGGFPPGYSGKDGGRRPDQPVVFQADPRSRKERVRRISSVVLDEAAYDPSIRFILVGVALFILFLAILVLSEFLG